MIFTCVTMNQINTKQQHQSYVSYPHLLQWQENWTKYHEKGPTIVCQDESRLELLILGLSRVNTKFSFLFLGKVRKRRKIYMKVPWRKYLGIFPILRFAKWKTSKEINEIQFIYFTTIQLSIHVSSLRIWSSQNIYLQIFFFVLSPSVVPRD